jgi:peroxiredoxin
MTSKSIKVYLSCLLLLCFSQGAIDAQARRLGRQDDTKSFTSVGQPMPSFTVTTLDGTKLSVNDLKGKIVLVNFWATWCPPCLVEMPRLEKEVWQKYKSSDFVMVAIAREQSEEEITAFRQEYKYSFPMAADSQREVYNLFGNGGIPRSYVVGTDGKIIFQSVGYNPREFDNMKKAIQKELAKVQKGKAGS